MQNLAENEIERLLKALLRHSVPQYRNKVFSVGGFVRDGILGIPSKDLDIAISELGGAEIFCRLLKETLGEAVSNPHRLGAAYPIWHMSFTGNVDFQGELYNTEGGEIDVVETQKECFPDPTSRQRITVFGTLDEDILRRDFTVNMLAYDLTNEVVVDLSERGLKDLEEKKLRFHPRADGNKIFSDDPLRMIRAVRFHCKYGFEIEAQTLACIQANAERIKIVSGERIRDELIKIIEMGKLKQAILMMDEMGLLVHIFPEVKEMQGVEQDIYYHSEGDVFFHTMLVVEKTQPTVVSALSSLLHDIGKPETQTFGEKPDGINQRISFKTHETVSAEQAEKILLRLKFDLETIRKIKKIIEFHIRALSSFDWSNSAVRKFIRDCDTELEEILHMTDCDAASSHGIWAKNPIPELRERIKKVSEVPVRRKPVLNGNDIMQMFEVKGKAVGELLDLLLEIEDEFIDHNQREITKEEAKVLLKTANDLRLNPIGV